MANKKKNGNLGVVENYKGQFISINLKENTYWGLGDAQEQPKIWLSPENWCDQVPEDLTNDEAESISKAVQEGKIMFGKHWLPAVDKDGRIKEAYLDLLNQHGGPTEQFKEPLRSLLLRKSHGGYTAQEIFNAMLVKEENGRKRPAIITFLSQAAEHYEGPAVLVEDHPNDPENFTVTINPDTNEITSTQPKQRTDRVEEMMFKPNPPKDDPADRQKKLDSLI